MDLPAQFFPAIALGASNVAAAAVLALAARRVAWRSLPPAAGNAWMGACVLALALWLLRGGLAPGLSFHLLGAGLFTLMMGPWLALLALSLPLLALALGGQVDAAALGVNWLTMVLPPVALSGAVLRLSQRALPSNLFVYVFVNGFLAGGAGMFAAGLSGLLALGLAGAYPWDQLLEETLPFYFLLSWSEAFTTGLLAAVLVVYRPAWMSTFDDGRYLGRSRRAP
ncbi:energy-coupling factor ABC transporter permease [Chromobacterium aquaticum]|uniref:Energy-coupling factor ABC transporter permease n=1 Tax=Chromobacterium aquaticum TaxID=467180 RepID=A0ABV8ZXC7_9NEIS|nr:energy-coupling factor ABC transporter permease [Chromobacterium aquaticum]MCD5363653.1 energy-coupling factor ABC transporter permease [Chromobacterium aquaticum]